MAKIRSAAPVRSVNSQTGDVVINVPTTVIYEHVYKLTTTLSANSKFVGYVTSISSNSPGTADAEQTLISKISTGTEIPCTGYLTESSNVWFICSIYVESSYTHFAGLRFGSSGLPITDQDTGTNYFFNGASSFTYEWISSSQVGVKR